MRPLLTILLAANLLVPAIAADSPATNHNDLITLEAAMNEAAENNADIAAKQAAVEQSREQGEQMYSALLPQFGANGRFSQIDNDRAKSSGRGVAESDLRAGISATQILYDDATRTRVKTARHATEQSKYEEERARLDAMSDAGAGFLKLQLARSLCDVERDNLALTTQHLAFARNRYRLGAASQDEVLRWEAQEAIQQGNFLTAEAGIEKARVALNRSMGADANEPRTPAAIALDDPAYYFLDDEKILGDTAHAAQFRDFSVIKAFEFSPELKQLDQALAAQRLVINQQRRGYYVPQISAKASYDRILDQRFAGQDFTTSLAAAGLPVSATRLDDNEWQIGLVASIPLWEGGARKHEIAASQAQIDVLEQTRVKSAQLIEQRVLNALFSIQASHPKIALARVAADRSKKSLKIVSDKYERGATQIIDVLDAQNQALREEINAAVALTTYLDDIIEFQRSIAWFEKFQTPESRAAWINHFRRFTGQAEAGRPSAN